MTIKAENKFSKRGAALIGVQPPHVRGFHHRDQAIEISLYEEPGGDGRELKIEMTAVEALDLAARLIDTARIVVEVKAKQVENALKGRPGAPTSVTSMGERWPDTRVTSNTSTNTK